MGIISTLNLRLTLAQFSVKLAVGVSGVQSVSSVLKSIKLHIPQSSHGGFIQSTFTGRQWHSSFSNEFVKWQVFLPHHILVHVNFPLLHSHLLQSLRQVPPCL